MLMNGGSNAISVPQRRAPDLEAVERCHRFERVVAGILGPVSLTENVNQSRLDVMDYFFKCPELITISNEETALT